MTPDLAAFAQQLRAHDWSYEMSDDDRVWKAGLASENAILAHWQALTTAGLGAEAQRVVRELTPAGASLTGVHRG